MASPYQIVGYKNRGKTNLICRLIDVWSAKGQSVATIKHDAHQFEFDRKGSDTWLHRHSGASWSAITAENGTAVVYNQKEQLSHLISMAPSDAMIIVEGFKLEPYPKLVLVRSIEDIELIEELNSVTAAVLWPEIWERAELRIKLEVAMRLPVFELDDTERIADHIHSIIHS